MLSEFEFTQVSTLVVFLVTATVVFYKTDMFIKRVIIEYVVIHRQAKRLKRAFKLAMLDKQQDIEGVKLALKQSGFDVIIQRILRESVSLKLDFLYVAKQLKTLSGLTWLPLDDGVRLNTPFGVQDYHVNSS